MKAIVTKIPDDENQSNRSLFKFEFVAGDGTTVLRSARYKSKDSAYKGVRAVKKNCERENRYIFKDVADGNHSFKIKSANGVAIVDSENFPSEQEMREAISFIKSAVPGCEIDFRTQSS